MAHQPFVPFLIICRNLLFPHVVQNLIQDHFILRYSKYAVPVRNRDDLMGSSGIESGNQIPFFIHSDRELCFIPVTERFLHSCDRLHDLIQQFFFHTAKTDQVISYFCIFKLQLFPVIHLLNLASATASCLRTACRYTKCGFFYNPH